MGRPNKGQHKIPRIYLEAFADVGGKVWISDKDLRLTNREPEKVLTEKDYYTIRFDTGGGTLVVETQFLGGIETRYGQLFQSKIEPKIRLDAKEKAELSVFVASMMERQPISRKSLEKFFSDVSEKVEHLRSLPDEAKKRMSEIMPISDHDRRNSISADELLKVGEDVGSFHSSLIPDTVVGIAPIINDMKWCFMVREPSAVEFLTSDNPCVMLNPAAEAKWGRGTFGGSPGLAQQDVEITLPLSPNVALLCGWNLSLDLMYVPVSNDEVVGINQRTARHAELLISSDKKILEEIIGRIKQKRGSSGGSVREVHK